MAFPTSLSQANLTRLPVLLKEIKQGLLRVPRFQRPFVWSPEQRLKLFDSVRKGIPIGSLLTWRTWQWDLPAYPRLGPFSLPLPEPAQNPLPGQSYLLDGHQRLGTLYGALHDEPVSLDAEEERWLVYYDLAAQEFCLPSSAGPPPVTWLSLRALLDPVQLYEHQKRMLAQEVDNVRDLVNRAENLANQFKDTLIAVNVLSSNERNPDPDKELDLVTQAFARINSQGTPLGEVDLASALAWTPKIDIRAGLSRAAEQLAPLGWGRIEPQLLFDILKAAADLPLDRAEPSQMKERLTADPGLLDNLFSHVKDAVLFLKEHCGVAGPAALPHRLQLIFLCEAVRIHGGPLADLLATELTRWFWFTSLTDSCSGLTSHQHRSALAHIRGLATGEYGPQPPDLPLRVAPLDEFNFDSSRSRALALLLAQEGPLDADGQPFQAAELLAMLGGEAVQPILTLDLVPSRGPENRWVADPRAVPRLREALRNPLLPYRDALLRSHAIPEEAAADLLRGDNAGFVEKRGSFLLSLAQRRFDELLRSAPATAPVVLPPEPISLAALAPVGVPQVAVQGAAVEWAVRAIAGAGLRRYRPESRTPPQILVEVLQRGTEDLPWRIRVGQREREVNPAGPTEFGEEALADALCRLRAAELAAEGPVRLALWTYAEDDITHPDAAYAVGALEPPMGQDPPVPTAVVQLWQERVERRFHERIALPLRRIRHALGARDGDRWVHLYPRCHLGVAVQAGAIFHHQSGFWVDCEQNGATWDINRQPAQVELPCLMAETRSPSDAASEETHLLISLSRDVQDGYNAWLRQGPGRTPRHLLRISHKGGPGPAALPAGEGVDWADAIRQRLTPLRTLLSAPLRIFCATPAAFAVALGRSLNAMGRVVTMDLSKQHGSYFSSFDFTV